jgi:hypothetical protein
MRYQDIIPLPETCPECGQANVRWHYEGSRSLMAPPRLIRGAWVHQAGFGKHAVIWTPEQVEAVVKAEES